MKRHVFSLLLGIIVGVAAFWIVSNGRKSPRIQRAQREAETALDKTAESAKAAVERAKDAVAAKLEALELRPEDIKEELAQTGKVLRRKSREFGETMSDAAADARITTEIKARLAHDPDISAWQVSVATTDRRVTLSGTVSSADLIGKAVLLAYEVRGVREVVSTLAVKP